MTTITTEQARTRYVTLPPALQDAVFSEQTAEIIAATLEKFHISEERGDQIPVLVGWVLLGFLHAEDLADEIAAAAMIPKPLAKEVADSLSNKIFEPLRADLSKFHAPVPNPMEAAFAAPKIVGATEAPKIISGTTFTATPGSQKNVMIGPRIEAGSKENGEWRMENGIVSNTKPQTPNSPLPADIGKPIPHFEARPATSNQRPAANTTQQITKTPTPNQPTAPIKKMVGEFERIATEKGAAGSQQQATNSQKPGADTPIRPLTPVTPTSKPPISINPGRDASPSAQNEKTPKPLIIQQSSGPKTIQNAPTLADMRARDILAGKKTPVPLPMKPAVVEFGGQGGSNKARNGGNSQGGSDKTENKKISAAPEPGRKVTEITAAPIQPAPTQPQKPIQPAPAIVSPTNPKPAPMPVSEPSAPQPSTPTGKPAGLAPINLAVNQPQPSVPNHPAQPPQILPQQQKPVPKPPQLGEKTIVKDLREGE
ncbi:MAG: hypothetical protein KGJ13_04915 [Patescibacteria group bacterium]|nr:hypothetical protein [Patescibacteria group bacterium]